MLAIQDSCVGQIAKLKGCRTVGIAGGPQKTELCTESFGFDAAVDYKALDFAQQLAAARKSGVDVYFDNTAGPISDAVHDHLNSGARRRLRSRSLLTGKRGIALQVFLPDSPGSFSRSRRFFQPKADRFEP
jgi:hypothetical protein